MSNDQLIMEKTLDNFASEKINTIANHMFGTYDKKGQYTISQPIKDELIKLTKYKKTTFNNSIFCVVNKPGIGELVFKVDYEKNSKDNVAKATLYLLENVYKVNGYLQDTIRTEIGEFVGDINGFIQNSYDKFNISTQWDTGDDDGRDYLIDEESAPSMFAYITAQKQFLEALDKLTSDKINKVYEEFFTEKLKVINSLGNSFSKSVLEDFRNEYAKVEKFFLSNKDYKALSELLDVCVERNRLSKAPVSPEEMAKYEMEKEYFDKISDATKKFTKEAEAIRENAVIKAKNRLDEVQKAHVEEIEKATIAPQTNSELTISAPETPVVKPTTKKPKPTITTTNGSTKTTTTKKPTPTTPSYDHDDVYASDDTYTSILADLRNRDKESTPVNTKPSTPSPTPILEETEEENEVFNIDGNRFEEYGSEPEVNNTM